MSSGRKELSKLLSSTPIISVYYWVSILNIFDKYRDELNIYDIRRLVAECERCRIDFNDDARDPIRKEDVNPNVYKHLASLEANIELNELKNESLLTNVVAVAQ